MTERVRSQMQESKIRFFTKNRRIALFNKARSSEIRKSLNIQPEKETGRVEIFRLAGQAG